MNQDERLISLTERLYVGFVKYVNFFEEEIIRLESELEKNGNGTKEAYKDMKIQYSDKMNNNINSVDKPISDNVDKYECLTKESSNNYSEEKINYDEMKKESQFTCNDILTYNESNKSQISDSKFKGSCESLEKLKLENDLELQKENHKIYNIYADRILFLYYQLKEGQQQQTSTILPVKSNDMENQIVYNSKETLSDLYHEETLNNVNKKELVDNTKLYKKSRDSILSRSDSITNCGNSLTGNNCSTTNTSLKKQLLASGSIKKTSIINSNQVVNCPEGNTTNNSLSQEKLFITRRYSQPTNTIVEENNNNNNTVKGNNQEDSDANVISRSSTIKKSQTISSEDNIKEKSFTKNYNQSLTSRSSSFLTSVSSFIFQSNSISKTSQINDKVLSYNNKKKLYEKYTSSLGVEMEIQNMMGRLQLEIKGILGFARLTTGDTFEITIKHGSQKFKSRGKTMSDKTQIWDTETIILECLPKYPLDVKVQEVKFFKSKMLSERSFDPSSFFTTTSQLVTMNLNSSGTIKLQFIITWIPLLASKTMINQQNIPSTNLVRSATQLSSMPYSPTITVKNSTSFSGAHSLNRAKSNLCSDNNTEKSRPRIVLRDKKRGKNNKSEDAQKDQWRASTTLLDAAYNNLSKSIPTLDSLSALKELSRSKNNLDQENLFHLEEELPVIEENPRTSKFFSGKFLGVKKQKQWNRSLSMHQLSVPDDQLLPCENGASSPKANSDKCNVEESHNVEVSSKFKNRDVNESFFDSTTSNSSGIGSDVSNNSEQGLKTIDELLGIIDKLRENISTLRKAELIEVNAFEAGMLSWESVLKFNRANLIEDRKFGKHSKSREHTNGYNKRSTVYNPINLHSKDNESHSLTPFDDLDDNVLIDSFHSANISKAESGLGSVKHSSPFINSRVYYGNYSPNISEKHYNINTLNGSCGPSQRRFKQFRERRKSIGLVFDQMSMSDISNGGTIAWNNGGDVMSTSDYSFDFFKSATSNSQLDDCLKHHLINALNVIKTLTEIYDRVPFEYKINQLLLSIDNATSALEEMMLINDNLPNIPNVSNMLSELGVECDVQELWLGICYSLSSFLIVPSKELTMKIYEYVSPIVSVRYPDLVQQVVSRFLKVMCDDLYWNVSSVSLYQFISSLRGKKLKTYFENLAHEAWISNKLMSNNPDDIDEIMYRLKNVPMIPPLESLRSIALVLLSDNEQCIQPICFYLINCNAELSEDLTSCFLSLLEHDDESTRMASCRVLSILKPRNVLKQLEYIMNFDQSEAVRQNAKHALTCIGFNTKAEPVNC